MFQAPELVLAAAEAVGEVAEEAVAGAEEEAGAPLAKLQVPILLPRGWSFWWRSSQLVVVG